MLTDQHVQIPSLDIKEVGVVKDVKHGIVRAGGLPSCIYGQLVELRDGLKGMVIGFNPSDVSIIALGDERRINVGDSVFSQSELLSVPVGEGFIGRAVSCLGQPLDGQGPITAGDRYSVFRQGAGVMDREPLTEPFLTGVKMLDLVIPIGKGQRELILGDRQTGKTSLALDALLNQNGKDVICIYCWIGGSLEAFKKIIHVLAQRNTFSYTIAVCAFSDHSPAEQYLCPYTAAALGEYFMSHGRDALVVFDDLTKHAWAYRQMSLLMERAPGREAYPGDIFYVHSQLMERAGRLKAELGGGTMTFLPIVETLQGDVTGYIQSNLVSMTDGQIYLNAALFREGFRPAIDMGLSVSRVGSKVQCPAVRELGGGLRLAYTQYREMLRMTKLRTRLSEEAMERLRRGEALRELLVQEQARPLSLAEVIVLFYAFKRKILEVLSTDEIRRFKQAFFPFLSTRHPELIERLEREQALTQDIKGALNQAFLEYFQMAKEAVA